MSEPSSRWWTIVVSISAALLAAGGSFAASIVATDEAADRSSEQSLTDSRRTAYSDYFGTIDGLSRIASNFSSSSATEESASIEGLISRWNSDYPQSRTEAAKVRLLASPRLAGEVTDLQNDLSTITEDVGTGAPGTTDYHIYGRANCLLTMAQQEIEGQSTKPTSECNGLLKASY
jgi:hypothetical protein